MITTKSVNEAVSLNYNPSMYKSKPFFTFIKRIFDILTSGLGLIVLFPVFLILCICVKFGSKGPAFYGHKRIGKNGKSFKVWKFRTMVINQKPLEEILSSEQLDEWRRNYKITNDPRVTRIGKVLRKASLDELPQLWNIFIGQMSVVGWRPILAEELERYSKEERDLLLKVKPGLTGFWASHGRSNTSYEDRIKMELYYPYKRGILLDIRILYHTMISVFKSDGAK